MRVDYQKILEDNGVAKEDTDNCMAWAFGEDWETVPPEQSSLRWNQRHGGLFTLKSDDSPVFGLRLIAIAFVGMKTEKSLDLAKLYDLNKSEETFRKIILACFKAEGIKDLNEMMDCLSWGLGYDKDLLACHTYDKWPAAFIENTGIDIDANSSIEKSIRLLARKWTSKKKITTIRTLTPWPISQN